MPGRGKKEGEGAALPTLAVAVWVRVSVEIESNDLYPALNRKLPIQHGSGAKELTGKKELNRRDVYSLQLLVIVPSCH